MDEEVTCPALGHLLPHVRVPVHRGIARLQADDATIRGFGEFVLPAEGSPIVAFLSDSESLSNDFANNLEITGVVSGTEFRLSSPQCYTRRPIEARGKPSWSLVSPINGPVRISYGPPRPVHSATIVLNNFDYEHGDVVETDGGGFTRIGTPCRVSIGDRSMEFRQRNDHEKTLALVRAGILSAATLTEVSLDADDSDDNELMQLALDVAALCTFAKGVSVSVAALETLDFDGQLVGRVITQPIRSLYRQNEFVSDIQLPQLFREAFDSYRSLRSAHEPWKKLASYCGAIEDAPYLEQKFANLITAVEFFMRNTLLEAGQSAGEVQRLTFPALVGATRKKLGWEVPKHYAADTVRLLRNSVAHGGEVPLRDVSELREYFNKWQLLLFRRILIRLGYSGQVESPHKGWASSSAVNDFSEEHNSFVPRTGPDPFRELIKRFRSANP